MKFLLEENSPLKTEMKLFTEELDRPVNKIIHSYSYTKTFSNTDKDSIPVGSIEFVQSYLDICFCNIYMKPIEVPVYLHDLLNRNYFFTDDLSSLDDKVYFIKDAYKLKSFTDVCRPKDLISQSKLYAVSDPINIISEWRTYVIDGKIENNANYDGDCLVYPDKDLIKEIVKRVSKYDCLESYTIDTAVTYKNETEILEIHPFCAVGLYSSLWGNSLIQAYIDGVRYYINKGYRYDK